MGHRRDRAPCGLTIPTRRTSMLRRTCRPCTREPGSIPAPISTASRSAGSSKTEYYPEPGLDDDQVPAQLLPDTDRCPRDSPCRKPARPAVRSRAQCCAKRSMPSTARHRPRTPTRCPNRTSPSCACRHRAATGTRCSSSIRANRSASTTSAIRPIPRIAHQLTLAVDAFGNVLRSAAIGYGRREVDGVLLPEDRTRQTQLLATYSENEFTQCHRSARRVPRARPERRRAATK